MADVDTVIFDLGGVLMANGRPADFVRHYPGVDPEALMAVLMGDYAADTDHPWHRVERGEITLAECKAANRAALAAAGIVLPRRERRPKPAPDANDAAARTASGFPRRFRRNEAMFELVADLRAAGLRTGILTNNIAEYRETWWPAADWPALFHDIVDSHEVRMRKPNPAIYHLAMERLGSKPATSVFLDDAPGNVAGAAAVGMTAYHVVDDGADVIEAVRRLVGL